MDWYVLSDEKTFGPLSFDDVLVGAREGRIKKDDLLWSTGMKDWVAATSVPGIWSPPPYQSTPSDADNKPFDHSETGGADAEETIRGPSVEIFERVVVKRRGFFSRYWNGDISLPKSYWLVGIGTVLFVAAVSNLFGETVPSLSLSPRQSGAALVTFLSLVVGIVVWQTVGLWRSAGKYIRTSNTPGWGWAARILLILSLVRASADFNQLLWPMFQEGWKQTMGIEDLPPYRMRLMNNASELEISGGMPFGTADAFQKLLDAAPTVKVIHLNSIGGRIDEGFKIKELIQAKGLATYTSSGCMSACTIAFLGGAPRLLSKNARLGFHSGSIGSLDGKSLPEINEQMREMLRESGVPEWFTNKVVATASSDMWYPSSGELVSANVVSKIVDPAGFAMSGVSDWQDEGVGEKILASIPLYAKLKTHDPAAYQALVGSFTEKIRQGRTPNDIWNEIRSNFTQTILPKYLKTAPDVALIGYMSTQLAEMKSLAAADAKYCVEYLFPQARGADFDFGSLLTPELQQKDLTALTNLLEQASKNPTQRVASERELQAVVAPIAKNHPEIAPFIANPEQHYQEPEKLCAAFQLFYGAILALPHERSGPVLRLMFN